MMQQFFNRTSVANNAWVARGVLFALCVDSVDFLNTTSVIFDGGVSSVSEVEEESCSRGPVWARSQLIIYYRFSVYIFLCQLGHKASFGCFAAFASKIPRSGGAEGGGGGGGKQNAVAIDERSYILLR